MKTCKSKTNTIQEVYLINPDDVKSWSDKGIVMKRKYGDRKREVFHYKID